MDDLTQDVIKTIIDSGSLSHADITLMWGLTDQEHAELKKNLGRIKVIEIYGRGKNGGWRAKYNKRAKKADDSQESFDFEYDWQQEGTERLVQLFSHLDLENCLGRLVYTVRRARQELTGVDRRGTKKELASALIIQHGIDLFRNKDIRKLVAKKCKIRPPGRWYAGKSTAIHFVKQAEFPKEFAGIPTPESPPDFEYLEGRIDLNPLEDFQIEVQKEMFSILDEGKGKAIVTLPTGAGKTRVAVDTIRDWLTAYYQASHSKGSVVLWLAHTEELCEQAYSCFKQVWEASSNVCPLALFRFWGQYTNDLLGQRENLSAMHAQPTILVSTPHRILNVVEGNTPHSEYLYEDLLNQAILVIVDEAHRAAAPSYKKIFSYFSVAEKPPITFGLTATPFRGEYDQKNPSAGTQQLKQLFRNIIEPSKTLGDEPRSTLQKRGYLAMPEWEEIETNTRLRPPPVENVDDISEEDIERIDYALKKRADSGPRRIQILKYLIPVCNRADSKIIYFGPTVEDAECMAFLLRNENIPSAFVSGQTRDVTRRQVIDEFKHGKVKVLCNCEVLTTGFDAPKVTHVVMARPTVSQVLYEQMVGRGLRGPKFGGTQHCVIIDCADNYRDERPVLGYRKFRDIWNPKKHKVIG